jgi:succinate dehydrogenase/fumarate reductase flavoprotein subunit
VARDLAENSDLKILVLEKLSYPGGSALLSGGAFWSGGNGDDTELTREKYVNTILQASTTTEFLNIPLLENIYDISHDYSQDMIKDGLAINEAGTYTMPDNGIIEWIGYGEGGGYHDYIGGNNLTQSLINMVNKLDIDLRLNSKATELLIDNGVVSGVVVEDKDSIYEVRAERVVLATGGFSNNRELMKQYNPDFADCLPFATAGSTGDGFALLADLEADIIGRGVGVFLASSMIDGYYGTAGSAAWTAQLYVNKEGEEYGITAENTFIEGPSATLKQTGARAYGVYDSSSEYAAGLDEVLENANVFKADTIEELANQMGVDADNMKAAAQKNQLTQAPFYGVNVVSIVIMTLPGVRVNENLQIMNTSAEAIPGVYAIGEFTFGNIM